MHDRQFLAVRFYANVLAIFCLPKKGMASFLGPQNPFTGYQVVEFFPGHYPIDRTPTTHFLGAQNPFPGCLKYFFQSGLSIS